jgi:hypothetical protein
MKSTKTLFQLLMVFSMTAAICSCNSNADTATTTEPAKDSPVASAPAQPEFTPFEVMEITHNVADYEKWRPFFNADGENRKANGLEDLAVGRNVDNPNSVLVALKVNNAEVAKTFTADPKLKEVMDKAGVVSKPSFELFKVIRYNPASKEKQWVIITHRVKDFDQEGPAQRASEGMVDVALARAVDDPNNVHIVLDITDMAKAKTALFSEGKKQLMMSAGVEGKPKIEFYTSAE